MLEQHGGIPREWRILLIFKKNTQENLFHFVTVIYHILPYFSKMQFFPLYFVILCKALFERYPMCHTFIFLQKLYLLLFT